MTPENEIVQSRRRYRAKLVASILTHHGLPVMAPDEASLDDVERERWAVCVQIETALSGMITCPKHEFHNALRILASIRTDPYRFFIRCDDPTCDALWAVVQRRSGASP